MLICCSSFFLQPQQAKMKTTVHDLVVVVVVEEREKEESSEEGTITTTMTMMHWLRGGGKERSMDGATMTATSLNFFSHPPHHQWCTTNISSCAPSLSLPPIFSTNAHTEASWVVSLVSAPPATSTEVCSRRSSVVVGHSIPTSGRQAATTTLCHPGKHHLTALGVNGFRVTQFRVNDSK